MDCPLSRHLLMIQVNKGVYLSVIHWDVGRDLCPGLLNKSNEEGSVQPLSWSTRLKIAIGAAQGLAFLYASKKKIIYRDFKSSNILLDEMAHCLVTHVTTRVNGTYGYAAPEYITTGHLYVKSNVYGFGVVLLEMLTGQRAIDTNRPSRHHNLVEWLKPSLSERRKLSNIIDPRLDGQDPVKGAVQAAQLTLKCLGTDPRNLPSMKEVVEALERLQAIKEKSKESQNDCLLVPNCFEL